MKNNYVFHMGQLKGEYLQAMKKAELYGQVHGIGSGEYDEMMMDLLDMLATAQEDGRPAEKIVGANMGEFCKNYFGAYTLMDRLKSVPKRCVAVVWLVLVIEMAGLAASWAEEGSFPGMSMQTDIGGYLVGLLLGWAVGGILGLVFQPLVFRIKKLTAGIYQAIVIAFLLFWLGIVLFSGIAEKIQVAVPLPLVLVGSVLYLLAYYGLCARGNYKKYGKILPPKNPETDSFSMKQQVKEQAMNDLPDELRKRFEKKNRKLARKGKCPQTPEAYMETLHKEVKLSKKICVVGACLIVLVCLGAGLRDMAVESAAEGLLTVGILIVAEIPAWAVLAFLYKANCLKEKLLEQCEELGITVIEYASHNR